MDEESTESNVIDFSTEREKKQKQVEILVRRIDPDYLFHDQDKVAYADVIMKGHRETWPLQSKCFELYLRSEAHSLGLFPDPSMLSRSIEQLESKAIVEGPCRDVHLRVAADDDSIYIDLCDEEWRAISVSRTEWKLVSSPPVRFRRTSGMLQLPIPRPGGSVESLKQFINVKADDDFKLVVAFALSALRGRGPYPVLVLVGEQGSAKSTLIKMIRSLIDPNKAPVRSSPREKRDLFVSAGNCHLLAFDNVSKLPDWLSDTMCQLATGGSFSTRQLYTDREEMLFTAARPIALNGIGDFLTRGDLADRSIILTLDPVSDRKTESDLYKRFENERSRIFGAMLDMLVTGLRTFPHTEVANLPRMADFLQWAVACGIDRIESAYTHNRLGAVESMLESSPLAIVVRGLIAENPVWEGTASDLLESLKGLGFEGADSPSALSGDLRRIGTALREAWGIDVSFPKRRSHRRGIRIVTRTSPSPVSPVSS